MEWITCENTYEEAWRRLLEYANIELAVEAISLIHGKPTDKTVSNYKKQAEQVRVSLLQAKEYFEAAKVSSLYTQPNHLYYGSVALSIACMLIRGDGTKSLDYLRKESKNSNHGLAFTFSSDINKSKIGLSLLDDCYVRICKNGHFHNWYSTLKPQQSVPAIIHNDYQHGSMRNMKSIGNYKIPKFHEMQDIKKNLIFILKRLPDLCEDLARYGVSVDHARGEHHSFFNENKMESWDDFVFHSSPSPDSLINVIGKFTCDDGVNFIYDIHQGKTSGVVRRRKTNKDNFSFSYPDSRMTMDHKTIYYSDSITTPEIVDLFCISYALSMLSRYYPDVWISFLESHCKGAKLVERVVRILTLKVPTLMLNQIKGTELIISNHRPLWH